MGVVPHSLTLVGNSNHSGPVSADSVLVRTNDIRPWLGCPGYHFPLSLQVLDPHRVTGVEYREIPGSVSLVILEALFVLICFLFVAYRLRVVDPRLQAFWQDW